MNPEEYIYPPKSSLTLTDVVNDVYVIDNCMLNVVPTLKERYSEDPESKAGQVTWAK